MLCSQVERGHGRGTLATRFEQLKADREPGVLALALSEEAATAFGRWLRGLSGAGSAQRPRADGRVDVPRGDDRWARVSLVTAPLSSPAFPSEQVAAEVAGGAVLLLLVGTHRDAFTGQAREVFRDVLDCRFWSFYQEGLR